MRSALLTTLQFSESIDMIDILLRRRNLLICKQERNIRAVCFEADGEQTVAITKVGSAPAITMQYSYNGSFWRDWDLSALPFGGDTKVYVRGVGNVRFGIDKSNYNKISFGTDAFVYVSGIAESLLDGENEVIVYDTPGILRNLFYQQTALRSAENLHFEAIRTGYNGTAVYAYMFYGCTNLLYAPKALTITKISGGYECVHMFQGCTSLVNAPELPATYIYGYVYGYMFQGCTSLVNAPELPATTLSIYCYQNMFDGCTSLKSIRCKAKVKANGATSAWLNGIATSGTFYGYSEYGWGSGGSGIPSGWEFVELTD